MQADVSMQPEPVPSSEPVKPLTAQDITALYLNTEDQAEPCRAQSPSQAAVATAGTGLGSLPSPSKLGDLTLLSPAEDLPSCLCLDPAPTAAALHEPLLPGMYSHVCACDASNTLRAWQQTN